MDLKHVKKYPGKVNQQPVLSRVLCCQFCNINNTIEISERKVTVISQPKRVTLAVLTGINLTTVQYFSFFDCAGRLIERQQKP